MALREQLNQAAEGLREVVELSRELQTIDDQLQSRSQGNEARDLLAAIQSLRGGLVTIRTEAPSRPSAGEDAIVETLRQGFAELRGSGGSSTGSSRAEIFSRGGF